MNAKTYMKSDHELLTWCDVSGWIPATAQYLIDSEGNLHVDNFVVAPDDDGTWTTPNVQIGSQVIIKEEWSDGDHRFPTIVIEDRGDRVLVMHDCGFTINPTEVVLKEWIY